MIKSMEDKLIQATLIRLDRIEETNNLRRDGGNGYVSISMLRQK